ncbi:S1 RNA-binding domain-containing protein [bacterium]|nr:S1 RNA-binding domain-containing protein [bacterium]
MSKIRFIDNDDFGRDPFAAEDNETTEFEKLLASESTSASLKRYRAGEPVAGRVLRVGGEYIFVDLGGKSTATLGVEEFTSAGLSIPVVGEEIQAYVRKDSGSEIILTRSLRRGEQDDGLLRSAFETRLPVEAKVEKVVKGGFEASLSGKRAFVPLSHMELGPISEPEVYVGQVLKFLIAEYKQGGKNIVLSRKSILKDEKDAKAGEILRTLEVGQKLSATITRLADFGAFADLGGVEGLIPMSELAWKRVAKAQDIVKIGDLVNVKVIRIEHAPRLRVALSLKQAMPEELMMKLSGKSGSTAGSVMAEERDSTEAWESYKSKKNQPASTSKADDSNIFAAAFASAQKRKQ